MKDLNADLENAGRHYTPPADALERLERRRERNQRNEKTTAIVVGLAVAAIAVGIVVLAFRPNHATQPAGPSGLPANGPIAFTVTDGGTISIALAQPDGSGRIDLTHGPADMAGLWSPDGSTLAYQREPGTEGIRLVNANGHDDRLLTDGQGYEPIAWSPDGGRFLFIRVFMDRPYVALSDGSQAAPRALFSINADGTGERRLTDPDAMYMGAAWTPDGNHIVYGAQDATSTSLMIMKADGSDKRQLAENAARGGISLSPDGTQIIYRARTDGGLGLFIMNSDGSDQRPLPVPDSFTSPQFSFGGWSPDGQKVLLATASSSEDGSDLWVESADGSDSYMVASGIMMDATWSPDGTRIAFTRGGDVWTMSAAGGDEQRVTDTPGLTESSPLWAAAVPSAPATPTASASSEATPAANGAGTLVYSKYGDGRWNVFSRPASGGPETQLTDGTRDYAPALSPDGTQVVFESEKNGRPDLSIMNANGSGQRQITDDAAMEADPAWSPDGRTIAFTEYYGDNLSRIDVLDVASGTVTKLTGGIFEDSSPSWSPDETQIVYSHFDGNANTTGIYVLQTNQMGAEGSRSQLLTSDPGLDLPKWSPDGTQILVIRQTDAGNELVSYPTGGSGRPTVLPYAVLAGTDKGVNYAAWSPDGTRIVYSNSSDVSIMNAQGSDSPQLLFRSKDEIAGLSWGPAIGSPAP